MATDQLQVRLGFFSATGRRENNQDYVASYVPDNHRLQTQGAAVVVADGVAGNAGGRVAAEVTARAFLDGYYSLPETLGVERSAARALTAANRWVFAQGQNDPTLQGMATTFTALILRRRQAHVIHVGDTRVYRWRDQHCTCLTKDHTHNHPDMRHVLYRAVGIEQDVRADYDAHALEIHDRFLLCSDGVYEPLQREALAAGLARRSDPQQTARQLVDAALAAGGRDNATALVLDVVSLPPADQSDLERVVALLPLCEPPKSGELVDGFELGEIISDGRYSRLYKARDSHSGHEVVLKFPQPRVAEDAVYRRAFVREAWIAARITSPWVAQIVELVPARQTRLYSVMPYYDGQTLEHRLTQPAKITLAQGCDIGIKLCKAITALNRRRIIHRDVKPDNVMLLPGGGLRLLDLGVARLPGVPDVVEDSIPGTPSYMAPELFAGERGDERSDVYAIAVTLFRMFSGGHYPYGEIEPFSRPRFSKRTALTQYRPDLPAWLDHTLAKALEVEAGARYADALELAFALESGLARGSGTSTPAKLPLYERNPVRFWQVVSLVLLVALLAALGTR
jgi:serine/threonine protein phosphatase PrpC